MVTIPAIGISFYRQATSHTCFPHLLSSYKFVTFCLFFFKYYTSCSQRHFEFGAVLVFAETGNSGMTDQQIKDAMEKWV